MIGEGSEGLGGDDIGVSDDSELGKERVGAVEAAKKLKFHPSQLLGFVSFCPIYNLLFCFVSQIAWGRGGKSLARPKGIKEVRKCNYFLHFVLSQRDILLLGVLLYSCAQLLNLN